MLSLHPNIVDFYGLATGFGEYPAFISPVSGIQWMFGNNCFMMWQFHKEDALYLIDNSNLERKERTSMVLSIISTPSTLTEE